MYGKTAIDFPRRVVCLTSETAEIAHLVGAGDRVVGVPGTARRPDAAETVAGMLEDAAAGRALEPVHPEASAAEALVRQRQPDWISYADWRRLDEVEVARGRAQGRPRVKLTSVEEMLALLGR